MRRREAPRDKTEFFPRWKALEFGNRIGMWQSLRDLLESGYEGTVTVRSRRPGGPCLYGVWVQDAASVSAELALLHGFAVSELAYNESAPDQDLLFQGEVTRLPSGLSLYGSAAKRPMREALRASGEHYDGVAALGRLRHYCNPNGLDMIESLLEDYPDAVVEFGCYSRHLGVLPFHNTIVWELRNY